MGSRQRSFIATAYYSFVLSLCVEVFQLITKVGSFDVDDLLLNTIGGICGYLLFAICAAIRRRHAGKKLRTEDDRIKAVAKARKKKTEKDDQNEIWTESSQTLQKGCLFLYLCSGDCISGDRDDSFFIFK